MTVSSVPSIETAAPSLMVSLNTMIPGATECGLWILFGMQHHRYSADVVD